MEVLKRWWYALPAWPPVDFDYSGILANESLREVKAEVWGKEQNELNGKKKVLQVPGYPGCFRDSKGVFYDLRPKETCPSFENFMKKDMEELLSILLKALENQLKDLKGSDYMNDKLAEKLGKMITRTQELVVTKKEEA